MAYEFTGGERVRARPLLLSLACGLTLAVLSPGQVPTFRTETRLVEVPVVVRDKKSGRTVEGLTATDFVVLENGMPRRIEHFSVHRAKPLRSAKGRLLVSTAKPPSSPNSKAQVYYLLAYRASRQKPDGRVVQLEVRIPGRQGLEVRHRRSYTAKPTEMPEQKRLGLSVNLASATVNEPRGGPSPYFPAL